MKKIPRVYRAITQRSKAAIARIKRPHQNTQHSPAATNVEGNAQYVYTSLPTADSFRLIELLPGMPGSPLRCNIVLTRRSDITGNYEALSYAWGEAIFSQQLEEVETKSVICITDNLYHALQTLRLEHHSRMLWVDAVCIAQANVREKSHQVRQMSLIYREAQCVVVWISRDDHLGVFEQLACLSRSPSHPLDYKEDDDNVRYIAYTDDEHYILYRYCRLQDVENFLGKPWFNRVWVVQEFVLAKQLRIHVGQVSMSGESFFRAIAFCLDSDKMLRSTWLSAHPNLNRTVLLLAFRRFHGNTAKGNASTKVLTMGGQIHMARSLELVETRRCSDDRDRFYALLGLLSSKMGIHPNYALNIYQVRMDVTKKSLVAGDLTILDYAESFTTTAESTSRPSFLVRIPCEELVTFERPAPLESRSGVSQLKHAVRFCVPHICDTGHSTIGIHGVSVDHVTAVIFFNKAAGVNPEGEISCLEELLDDFRFHPGQNFISSLNLVLMYKYILSLRSSPLSLSPSEHNAFERGFWRIVNVNRTRRMQDILLGDFESFLLSCEISTEGFLSTKGFWERTFFVTELGFFGLCSRWTRKGDHVVFFGGMSKPYTLRPVDGEDGQRMWKLIGDCFIEDCMEGHYFEPETYDTCGKEIDKDAERMPDERFSGRTKALCEEQFILCRACLGSSEE